MAMTVGPLPPTTMPSGKERQAPPAPSGSYSPKRALDDLPGTQYALELFLASKMVESEEYCDKCDPKKERLYFATGYGLIQTVKAMMSYDDNVRVSQGSETLTSEFDVFYSVGRTCWWQWVMRGMGIPSQTRIGSGHRRWGRVSRDTWSARETRPVQASSKA